MFFALFFTVYFLVFKHFIKNIEKSIGILEIVVNIYKYLNHGKGGTMNSWVIK